MTTNFQQPTLEDLFGAPTARQAEFGQHLNQRFPNVSGNYRSFLENQAPAFNRAFGLQDVASRSPTNTFGEFLNSRGVQSFQPGGGASNSLLAVTANLLRGGPNAPNLTNSQRAGIEGLSSNPRAQFDMALDPQINSLASRFRPSFRNLADRRFDSILAEQGTRPDFQMLPFLQNRGFNFFQ